MYKQWLLLPVLLLGAGCGLFRKKEEPVKPWTTAIVGEVTSVHPNEGFILFRRYGPGDIPFDGLLSSRSPDGIRATGLTLSPETMGRFYTADFTKEAQIPREGDLVVLSRDLDDKQNEEVGP